MKIVFVLTVHLPDDERIWYQQAEALKSRGHEVFVISSKIESSKLKNVICFSEERLSKKMVIKRIKNILFLIKPEIIICDNPISVIAAKKYSNSAKKETSTIYDITEWYPSTINLRNANLFMKIIKFCVLSFLSFYAGCIVDKFIFGEYYKSRFFRILFPLKKFIFLPYYADIEHVKRFSIQDISKRCEFFYSGNLSKTKGFDKVLIVAEKCAEKNPNTHFVLKIISSQHFDFSKTAKNSNLEIKCIEPLPFLDFCSTIGQSDIFLDLRSINILRNRSLPIKIFYYLAAGRPVIYSEIKAIKKFFPNNEIEQFGKLVNPSDIDKIVESIENYIMNQDLYNKSCLFSYEITKNKYNWKNIKEIFIDFIENND
jgi:glycosyltransferase involved in cell wall biosynthesis